MPPRRLLAALLLVASRAAVASPPDGGFHLEPKPVIDDVFGDAGDYRRTVDRFLQIADNMQRTRDRFARSVQAILGELKGPSESRGARRCPEQSVAAPYARAIALGQEYLRAGRELTRYYESVREWDRLGETAGLTPDYRAKVKRVQQVYQSLLTDYREMKVAFYDQLTDELRYAGCNLEALATRGGSQLGPPKDWPAPDQPGAPGARLATGDPSDRGALPQPPTPSLPVKPLKPEPIGDLPQPARAGILFYVDNTRCASTTRVALDGRPIGEVPGATRAAFTSTPGPHDLCLAAGEKKCGEPGTVRKSYLHEGWTIALRCE